MDTGTMIMLKRKEFGMTMQELGDKLGVSKSTVNKWEKGYYEELKLSKLSKIAEVFDMSPLELCCFPDDQFKTIPIVGEVVAGYPVTAYQNIIGKVTPTKPLPDGDYFGLTIHGDSMSPRIQNGDIVIVKQQPTAENGDIVIAMIDDETTCKKFYQDQDGLKLIPLNESYEPICFTPVEVEEKRVQILGVVIENRQQFK